MQRNCISAGSPPIIALVVVIMNTTRHLNFLWWLSGNFAEAQMDDDIKT